MDGTEHKVLGEKLGALALAKLAAPLAPGTPMFRMSLCRGHEDLSKLAGAL